MIIPIWHGCGSARQNCTARAIGRRTRLYAARLDQVPVPHGAPSKERAKDRREQCVHPHLTRGRTIRLVRSWVTSKCVPSTVASAALASAALTAAAVRAALAATAVTAATASTTSIASATFAAAALATAAVAAERPDDSILSSQRFSETL